MQKTNLKRFYGRIVSVPDSAGYAFIGARTITLDDGSDHGLAGGQTLADVFIHQDECAVPLRVGMTVDFDLVADRKRGANHFRAIGAVEIVDAELLPDDDPVLSHLSSLPVPAEHAGGAELAHPILPHPWHSRMKEVDQATIAKVEENNPLTDRTRDEHGSADPDDPRVIEGLKMFVQYEFPHMAGLELGYDFTGG